MAATESARILASILYRTAVAAPAPNAFSNVGVKNITRIAGVPAGGWRVELDEIPDFRRCIVTVTPENDQEFSPVVKEEASGGGLEIRTFNAAGALADCSFWLEVKQTAAALREDQRFL